MPGQVVLETLTLEELDATTRRTDEWLFQSVKDREGMLKSGMEEGSAEAVDRLAGLLEETLERAAR